MNTDTTTESTAASSPAAIERARDVWPRDSLDALVQDLWDNGRDLDWDEWRQRINDYASEARAAAIEALTIKLIADDTDERYRPGLGLAIIILRALATPAPSATCAGCEEPRLKSPSPSDARDAEITQLRLEIADREMFQANFDIPGIAKRVTGAVLANWQSGNDYRELIAIVEEALRATPAPSDPINPILNPSPPDRWATQWAGTTTAKPPAPSEGK